MTEYRYAREIQDAFEREQSLHSLLSLGQKHGFVSSEDALVFIQIQSTNLLYDNRTRLVYTEKLVHQNALSFMLAHPYGVSFILSSYKLNKNQGLFHYNHLVFL